MSELPTPELPASREWDLTAIIAHEMRKPLVAMWYTLEACRSGADGLTLMSAQEVLTRQLRHVLRLIDDLLERERLEQQGRSAHVAPIDLVQLVRRVVQRIEPRILSRKQSLSVDVPVGSLTVQGDAQRLEQIVANLLDNSCKFADEGGRISIRLARESDQAVLRVRDDGCGISPEDLPRIFEVFFRPRPASDKVAGLGVGLALTRYLVGLHGGTIEARSDGAYCGSEFIVHLPVAP